MTDTVHPTTGEITTTGPNRASPTLGKLAEALAKAQGEIAPATKDATNPHLQSKYADLPAIWEACRGPLAKYGLAVIQRPGVVALTGDDLGVVVATLLVHTSGEWIESNTVLRPVPDKSGQVTPQIIGSAITYGRRYGLAAMVGVVADTDDDAASASAPRRETPRTATPTPLRPFEGQRPPAARGGAHAGTVQGEASAREATVPKVPSRLGGLFAIFAEVYGRQKAEDRAFRCAEIARVLEQPSPPSTWNDLTDADVTEAVSRLTVVREERAAGEVGRA